MNFLSTRLLYSLAKWSKPKPKMGKLKEEKKSFAIGDEKSAKLSKSEQELENKQKVIEEQKIEEQTKRNISIFRAHDKSLEEYISPEQLENIRVQQLFYLKGVKQRKKAVKSTEKIKVEKAKYLINENFKVDANNVRKAKNPTAGNYTSVFNQPFKNQLHSIEGNLGLRRMGTLGIKLGMTTMWNRWGHMIPVTAIELDRVQIVQIKEPQHENQFFQVQMGLGEKNMKKISKSMLGHFVKSSVPPKRVLSEFKVSKECLLPVGYMMTPRHYTPGMFVDVVGKTVGHGFQGTIKKHGFRRQPQSHGNSLTTRVLGSTGGRQDPGRVFKNKKMYGQMGNRITVQTGIQIFKIDVDKNLLYLKGSVPGKAGTIIKIRDTLNIDKLERNLELVHYPTFIEEEGKTYARQMSMYCGQRDPDQIEVHDNAYILDDENEEAATETKQTLPEE